MADAAFWATLRHFKASEFKAPARMSAALLKMLDDVRDAAGVPLCITSDYRQGDPGAHGDGDAVDIADNMQGALIGSRWRFLVLKAAMQAGFRRVGDYGRHLHLDVSTRLDQDVVWFGDDSRKGDAS